MLIKDNPESVFCAPPPGKPRSNEPLVTGQLRSRVVRHGQKGDTCLHTAMRILLDEALPPKGDRSRAVQLLSKHKKTLVEFSIKWEPIEKVVAEIYGSGLTCTKATAPLLLQSAKDQKEILEHVQKFSTQKLFDDFELYIKAAKQEELESIHKKLLNDLAYPTNQLEEYCQSTFGTYYDMARNPNAYLPFLPVEQRQQALQTLSHIRTGLIHGFYARVAKEIYGLEFSSWNPEQPITELIHQLRLHGPHLVIATIGKPIYATPPIPLKDKIEGRTIWGWTPNAERYEGVGSHAIVIVGAEVVNNRGYVYFLDPVTESRDLDSQEIFKVSYDRLLTTIFDLRQRNDALRKTFAQKSQSGDVPFFNEYALYCPKK